MGQGDELCYQLNFEYFKIMILILLFALLLPVFSFFFLVCRKSFDGEETNGSRKKLGDLLNQTSSKPFGGPICS